MKVSKIKVLVIFLIVCSILFKSQFEDKISQETSTFALRRVIYKYQELPSFPNDYVAEEYAKIYLNNFLNVLQNDINADISKFVEETYYKEHIESKKDTFIQNMKQNTIMVNPISNYHDLELITEYVNKDGHKTFAYNILVMEKGLSYPRGYESLKDRNDPDKLKNMDIHVIEYSPYNFKIIFPDKTKIVEEY